MFVLFCWFGLVWFGLLNLEVTTKPKNTATDWGSPGHFHEPTTQSRAFEPKNDCTSHFDSPRVGSSSSSQFQMSVPIILSDDEDEEDPNAFSTLFHSKKRRTETSSNPNPKPKPTVLILDDDDPIPQKSGPTSPRTHLVAETPLSDIEILDFTRAPSSLEPKFSGWLIWVISLNWFQLGFLG